MKISVTLEFTDPLQAARILAQVSNEPAVTAIARINPMDNPEAGGTPMPPSAVTSPAPVPPVGNASGLAFGQGVTLPAGATPALSTAAVAATPIAPVAPPVAAAHPGFGFPAPALPTAPVAVVPTAPVAPSTLAPSAPPAPSGPVLDKTGLPWDGRIHAGTQGQNKDGTWKAKKNLDPNVKVQVEAELRAALAANAAHAPVAQPSGFPDIPPAPNAGSAPPVSLTDSTQTGAVTQAQVTAALGPTTASGKPLATTFVALMEQVSEAMMAGRLDAARIMQALQPHGLAAIGQLSYATNVIPAVAQDLAQHL